MFQAHQATDKTSDRDADGTPAQAQYNSAPHGVLSPMDTFDFVNRANAEYIDRLYQQYQKDPRSVEDHWKAFFAGFELGLDRTASTNAPAPVTEDGKTPTDWATAGIYDLVHSY